jgi:hypothetical protein
MEFFVQLLSFAGAWLLFAGPLYQAAQELLERDLMIERERIEETKKNTPLPPQISPLWWFLPPVKFYLERRRSQQYRQMLFASLRSEEMEALVSFLNKANGWLMVAGGGLLVAMRETYEFCHMLAAAPVVFWLASAGMAFLSILYTVLAVIRSNRLRSLVQTEAA